MLSSIDSCQNRVSADQYHLTVLRAQVSTHRGGVFFEVIRWQITSFKWSQAQVYFFQWFIWNMLCLCHYGPALLRFWLQTDLGRENSASFFKNSGGDDLFLPWTRDGHALRPIFMLWLVKIAAGSTSENAIVKVLGSIWNTDTDQFTFDLLDLSQHASLLPTMKRSLLKISAKIFDPLGLLSPFTIQWKVLFQELCIERTDWDDQLKGDHLKKWKSLILELQTLNSVCIPRCYFDYPSGNLKAAELHCFSDASEKAYAASIYVRSIYEDGRIDVNWLHRRLRSHLWRNKASLGLSYLALRFSYVWLKPYRTPRLRNWKPCSGSTQWLFYVG